LLPPSVEVVDQTFSKSLIDPFLKLFGHIPRYLAPDSVHFCVENDCLLGGNGRELIQYQSSLATFSVSRAITDLFAGSFTGNSTLTTLTFEDHSRISRFSVYCFFNCPHLRSVHIPNSIRVIEAHCFEKCSELSEVTFEPSSSIHTIESSAFSGCALLATFNVPSSVVILGESVFSRCSLLSSVQFEAPSHLANIHRNLFSGCDLLDTIHLPDSLQTIDDSAFSRSGVTFVDGADCVTSEFFVVRLGRIFHCFRAPSSLTIPPTVREIGASAFSRVNSIVELKFSQGLVRIGASAFSDCLSAVARSHRGTGIL
jgi:hypothetical protein